MPNGRISGPGRLHQSPHWHGLPLINVAGLKVGAHLHFAGIRVDAGCGIGVPVFAHPGSGVPASLFGIFRYGVPAFEAALCLQADNHLESLAFAFFYSPLPVAGLLLCVGHRHVAPLDWLRCKQMMAHPGSYCVTTQPSVRESIAWTHIKKSGGHFLFSRPACVGGEGIPTFSSGRGWVHEAAQISAQRM